MAGEEVFDFDEVFSIVTGEWDRRAVLAKIYEPARQACWSALRSHALPQDLADRRDALERLLAFLQLKAPGNSVSLQHQIGALRDLLNDSLVFQIQHPWNELRNKPHVVRLLKCIRQQAQISRKQLLIVSGLKEANLSRLLGLVEGAGLIRRGRNSDGVFIEILPMGIRMIEDEGPFAELVKTEAATPSVTAIPPVASPAPISKAPPTPDSPAPRKHFLRMNREIDGTIKSWAKPNASYEMHQ